MVDPPLNDDNARVCSHHFTADDYVKAVLPGFGPKNPQLKDTAVPTRFSFAKQVKRRKLSPVPASLADKQFAGIQQPKCVRTWLALIAVINNLIATN